MKIPTVRKNVLVKYMFMNVEYFNCIGLVLLFFYYFSMENIISDPALISRR